MRHMIIVLLMGFVGKIAYAQEELVLYANDKSDFSILVKEKNTLNNKAAGILQDYFQRATTWQLPISYQQENSGHAIMIGFANEAMVEDAFEIRTNGRNVYIDGGAKGLIYGVYRFIEEVLDARKWNVGREGTFVPKKQEISIATDVRINSRPRFAFREAYFPIERDQEYMDWHGLHNLEELWGLWGHTFNKLLPASIYFKEHPDYYSFYQGKRQPNQLCLSNPEVYRLVVEKFREMMTENPQATYWSLSPNDELGYCECDKCRKIDEKEGGPQGSLIHFVNRVAQHFPNKKFTTLAYTYSANPPLHISPLPNVYVILSSIDARRGLSLPVEPTAASFRSQLAGWKKKTEHLFIWDYYTQFTNYMAPFPQWGTIGENMAYLDRQGVEGIFAQGSGTTYSHMAELKSYLLAKLLWNPQLDEKKLTEEFVKGFYGKAADEILEYLSLIRTDILSKRVRLDIYGNPIDNHQDFLSPEAMDRYSDLFDRAEEKVEANPIFLDRVRKIRLGYEYVYFQQAKFYGPERHGIFQEDNGKWVVRSGFKEKLNRFLNALQDANVHELSEGGMDIETYRKGWEDIFTAGVRSNKASEGKISLRYPYVEDFPAKGNHTLHDRVPGYLDFSYNWLVFNGNPFEATVRFDKPTAIHAIETHFLEDPRHWFFRPRSIQIQLSVDGKYFKEIYRQDNNMPEEDYSLHSLPYKHTFSTQKVKAIKIIAHPFQQLPEWRFHPRKRPSIAIDEIWVD